MERIEEIRKRTNPIHYDYVDNGLTEDIEYLFSLIDRYRKNIETLGMMDDPDKIEKYAKQSLEDR